MDKLCLFLPAAIMLESIFSPLLMEDIDMPSASAFMKLLFMTACALVTLVIQLVGCVACSADFRLSMFRFLSVLIVIFLLCIAFFWPF